MLYDQGCFGQVELGAIPEALSARLTRVPGEWLEFEPGVGAIVVRHVEPTASPPLPAIACELVRLFSHIPAELHGEIPGGDLFVHTEDGRGELVRIRVERGGAIHIQWAHPNFKRALREPYEDASAIKIDPEVQRLNGSVSLDAADPSGAVAELQDLADTYEGLYPEGDFVAGAEGSSRVEVTMEEVNLDAALLVEFLHRLAEPGSLSGRFEVSSFGTVLPEKRLRIIFEGGKTWVQHPLLWPDAGQASD